VRFRPEYPDSKTNNEKYYLIGIFFVLVAVKSVLTISMQTPWIFADEAVYDNIAQNILHGELFSDLLYCQTYPPGYSIFLSAAYLLSGDKTVIYHVMLIMNSILTSSVIFPSYYILKKYIAQQQALLGSLLIAVLPAVTLYTFVLMSENLFIPLTVFSIWFLHEAFEHNSIKWSFLAGISVFYLYFTRETGLVFCIALLAALAFFIIGMERGARLKAVKDKAVLLGSFAVPFLLWGIYKRAVATGPSLYGTGTYVSTLAEAFSDIELFVTFFTLVLHEIEYLALSGYIFVFVIALAFIAGALVKRNIPGPGVHLRQSCPEKVPALRAVVVYCLTFSAGLLVITVTHMQMIYITGNQYYAIFGRYLDPVVPVLFLFGILGAGYLHASGSSPPHGNRKAGRLLLVPGLVLVSVMAVSLPHTHYKFPNMFGIYYLPCLQEYLPFAGIMLLLAVVCVVAPSVLLGRPHGFLAVIGLFIAVSVLVTVPTYSAEVAYSDRIENVNQIGRYLQEHASPGSTVMVDPVAFDRGWYPVGWFSTAFWSPGELTVLPLEERFLAESDYLVSNRSLDYPVANRSRDGYALYATGRLAGT
jgi:hypothetical protein